MHAQARQSLTGQQCPGEFEDLRPKVNHPVRPVGKKGNAAATFPGQILVDAAFKKEDNRSLIGEFPRPGLTSALNLLGGGNMLMPQRTLSLAPWRAFLKLGLALLATVAAGQLATGAEMERVTHANYKQAFHFSPEFLRQFVYDVAVTPNWIGKTDTFWYSYRTSRGTTYWRVDCRQATKVPLFDAVKLATLLSQATQKPLDAAQLPLTRITIDNEGAKIKFVVETTQYEYDLQGEKLAKLGPASPLPVGFGGRGGRGNFQQQFQQQQQQNQLIQNDQQRRGRGQRGFPPGTSRGTQDYRAFSPDRKAYVFVRNANLYLLDTSAKPSRAMLVPPWPTNLAGGFMQIWSMTRGATWLRENQATQLSTDGGEDYSFGRMGVFGQGMDDQVTPPQVQWSADSKAFYATRVDARGVQDLYLVNAITLPRPTLEKYKYPMPGEAAARRMELFVCQRATGKLIRIPSKWKDEVFSNIHWGKNSDELRFVRRDRLVRHAEFCSANVRTGETKCLLLEGYENADVSVQPAQYIEESNEMIWWSERSGWAHYYLYDRNGTFENAITTGLFRADRVVAVDAKNRLLYFVGNGREPGENIYYQHLYSVHLDGTGLTLMDPDNAHHVSVLSPSHQFVVDNCSRVDMAPLSVLRSATGRRLLTLEEADVSRLVEVGWRMPERFSVKAADGVTELYGNLWKPFDFDPKQKYPIIAHVYPGPQTEGVTHTFSPISGEQQLAQLGFIVIQVGHRGGTPARSKAYGSFGYFNLRDYALADTKSAVEQLAARHRFMDLDRVGIYGHSGGGFMSAAAVLQKPYNEFFKAAVASSGNHDNNIYNNGWAERYHGMIEVAVKKEDTGTRAVGTAAGSSAGTGQDRNRTEQSGGQDAEDDVFQQKQVEQTTQGVKVQDKDTKPEMRYEIKVPTNAELAANLKGALLLVHGDMDNNVHPANTLRLVDALIKANKRFEMLILPGQRHGYGPDQPYFTQRMWDFFADHLLGDRQAGADIYEKRENHAP
jgi:dipeptidyl aminopeptidase/acylaminoacyl peptidase